jgi:hypothetical protein
MLKVAALLALVSLPACASVVADEAPTFTTSPVVIFAATADLAAHTQSAADRIFAATGIEVLVTNDPNAPSIPMFWTTQGEGDWFGVTHISDNWFGPLHVSDGTWIGIDMGTPGDLIGTVVLHEVLHALGAEHVGTGEGVLSPEVFAAFPITKADLESVCAVRSCTAFVAE